MTGGLGYLWPFAGIRDHSCSAVRNFDDGTYEIIGCAMHVHRSLGPGLREKPYENALVIALRDAGLPVSQQAPYPIRYEGSVVGDCIPDITSGEVLIDAKSVDAIGEAERAQMLNYLRIARKRVGLVLNFKNSKLQWERLVR